MIEPTETETLETLDRFIEVMKTIARESEQEPDMVKSPSQEAPKMQD